MVHKASLDKTAIVITLAVTLLFAVIIGGQYPLIKDEGGSAPMFAMVICIFIYFFSLAFRPLDYRVTPQELIIRRPLVNVRLKIADIQSVEWIDKHQIAGAIRTFGVGGLFGYYGQFANLSLGRMTWYATRRDKPVLIKMGSGQKIILTPDQPERLIEDVKNQQL